MLDVQVYQQCYAIFCLAEPNFSHWTEMPSWSNVISQVSLHLLLDIYYAALMSLSMPLPVLFCLVFSSFIEIFDVQ